MNLVETRAATRRYPGNQVAPVTAVDRADLEVAPGQFVAIEGPSGSGKTTLLGLLGGLELPDEGAVILLGHDLARLSLAERARLRRQRVGSIFQSYGLLASLDVLDNVALPLTLAGISGRERVARATAALAEVGMADRPAARVDELSGGERQRVGIARALVIEPWILLADEPTGSLDDEHANQVLDLLTSAVRARGAALVLVTHDATSAARADRRFVMRDGRLAPYRPS